MNSSTTRFATVLPVKDSVGNPGLGISNGLILIEATGRRRLSKRASSKVRDNPKAAIHINAIPGDVKSTCNNEEDRCSRRCQACRRNAPKVTSNRMQLEYNTCRRCCTKSHHFVGY